MRAEEQVDHLPGGELEVHLSEPQDPPGVLVPFVLRRGAFGPPALPQAAVRTEVHHGRGG